MTVFIKQYGRTILYVIFAVAVLGISFGIRKGEHTGFVQAAYQKAEEGRTARDVTAYTDVDAIKEVTKRKVPEITFLYQKIFPGIPTDIRSLFLAKDAQNGPADVEIMDILDAAGNSVLFLTDEDRKDQKLICDLSAFVFPRTGIYTLKVKASDKEKKTAYREYKIPVTSSLKGGAT